MGVWIGIIISGALLIYSYRLTGFFLFLLIMLFIAFTEEPKNPGPIYKFIDRLGKW